MQLQQMELIGQAEHLILGMKSLYQLLETPGVPPVTADVLVVFECAFDKLMELIEETIAMEVRAINEVTEGKE